MGIDKANTSAYHPQTDGLVERFNRHGTDWDERLPYVLFAYRSSLQQSTRESPFFLLYGRDPRLPTQEALTPPKNHAEVNLDDYKSEMTVKMAEAWEMAQAHVWRAQQRQKVQHDRRATNDQFCVGDRVYCMCICQRPSGERHTSLPSPIEGHTESCPFMKMVCKCCLLRSRSRGLSE